jgi:hypothetical protein
MMRAGCECADCRQHQEHDGLGAPYVSSIPLFDSMVYDPKSYMIDLPAYGNGSRLVMDCI